MLHIHAIPALTDNYFWLIQPDTSLSDVYAVDPGDAAPVYSFLTQHKLDLRGIFLTHHHNDHIAGASELGKRFDIPIYGPCSPRIPQVTHSLRETDELSLGSIQLQVLEIPGHTLDHIAYLIVAPDQPPHLFSGDTLFAAGCGRLFDGTAELLHKALHRISTLPSNTLIYGGHEYTLANIRFALTIEPENADLIARQTTETQKRANGIPTLPTSLELEQRTNPFLRCHLRSVHTSVENLTHTDLKTELDVFIRLRLLKDSF